MIRGVGSSHHSSQYARKPHLMTTTIGPVLILTNFVILIEKKSENKKLLAVNMQYFADPSTIRCIAIQLYLKLEKQHSHYCDPHESFSSSQAIAKPKGCPAIGLEFTLFSLGLMRASIFWRKWASPPLDCSFHHVLHTSKTGGTWAFYNNAGSQWHHSENVFSSLESVSP